jgi:hypothetical protein
VLARLLWPRSIVQPPLTVADRVVLAGQALQNQRRDDQHIAVSFDDGPPGAAASGKPPQAQTRPCRLGNPRLATAPVDARERRTAWQTQLKSEFEACSELAAAGAIVSDTVGMPVTALAASARR